MTLKEITVGARRRDTCVAVDAPSFKAPSLAPGGAMLDLPAIDFPQEQLEGLTEQNYQSEIVIWTRFEDPAGNRWEVVWDPETRTQTVDLLA